MTGQLTTHVHDLVLGHGAGELKVWVRRIVPPAPWLGEAVLDTDGRGVLLSGEAFQTGLYELNFHVGDYHRARGLVDGDAFLEDVPIRFRVLDVSCPCHVALQIGLYGYGIYRGG